MAIADLSRFTAVQPDFGALVLACIPIALTAVAGGSATAHWKAFHSGLLRPPASPLKRALATLCLSGLSLLGVGLFHSHGLSAISVHYNERGQTALAQGNLIEAKRSLQQALSLDAGNTSAYFNQGLCLKRLSNNEQALKSMQTAYGLSSAPSDVLSKFTQKACANQSKEVLAQELEVSIKARLNLGTLLIHKKAYAEALSVFSAGQNAVTSTQLTLFSSELPVGVPRIQFSTRILYLQNHARAILETGSDLERAQSYLNQAKNCLKNWKADTGSETETQRLLSISLEVVDLRRKQLESPGTAVESKSVQLQLDQLRKEATPKLLPTVEYWQVQLNKINIKEEKKDA